MKYIWRSLIYLANSVPALNIRKFQWLAAGGGGTFCKLIKSAAGFGRPLADADIIQRADEWRPSFLRVSNNAVSMWLLQFANCVIFLKREPDQFSSVFLSLKGKYAELSWNSLSTATESELSSASAAALQKFSFEIFLFCYNLSNLY